MIELDVVICDRCDSVVRDKKFYRIQVCVMPHKNVDLCSDCFKRFEAEFMKEELKRKQEIKRNERI